MDIETIADIITVRYIWLNQRKSEVLSEICKVTLLVGKVFGMLLCINIVTLHSNNNL